MSDNTRAFSPTVQAVIEEFVPICRALAEDRGRYAIAVGGSQGKGLGDGHSDVDFRLYHEQDLLWPKTHPERWQDYQAAIERWAAQGVMIDGIWPRKIEAIEAGINRWLEGRLAPDDLVWTIWGYHLLPDMYHQAILEDPYGIIAGWKARLAHYPPALKQAILDKYAAFARYWRTDYHYANKVRRGDLVFAAGLTSKLIHALIQILFALNETYYVGDGQNLDFCAHFRILPDDFAARVALILYPPPTDDRLTTQRDLLAALVDDVLRLV